MPTFPFPEIFTILSRSVTGQDGDGNDVYGTTETATSGAFAPEGSTELIQGQNTVIDHPRIYLSDGATTPVVTDRIRREATGEVFDIDGRPAAFHNPYTDYEPGAVLHLERVTG